MEGRGGGGDAVQRMEVEGVEVDGANVNVAGPGEGGDGAHQDVAGAGVGDAAKTIELLQAQIQALLSRPVNIQMTAPPQVPRLKPFSGATPPLPGEATFQEWEVQVEQLQACREILDAGQRIKSSLKGMAWELCRDMSEIGDILVHLKKVYGSTRTSEDWLEAFLVMTPDCSECPSSFLLRQYAALSKATQVGKDESKRTLFRSFVRAIAQSHPLLALELRTSFGQPGTAAPDFADLMKLVKEQEKPCTKPSAKAHSNAQEAEAEQPQKGLSETDLEKIIVGVTERLQSQLGGRRRPKGHCYNCGRVGDHYARQCKYPADPVRVAAEKAKQLNDQKSSQGGE